MTDSTNITPETIAKLAKLSRLKLTDQEINNGTEQLSHVLNNFAMIQSIDTDDSAVSQSPSGVINVSRSDVANPNNLCDTKSLIENAPQSHKGQVKVKAVFS